MPASRTALINLPGVSFFIKPAAALANAYRFVTADPSAPDSVVLSAAGDDALGVVYAAYAANEDGQCIAHGQVLVEAGGTIALGDYVSAGALGVAVKGATAAAALGRCLVGGGLGDLVSVDLDRAHSVAP